MGREDAHPKPPNPRSVPLPPAGPAKFWKKFPEIQKKIKKRRCAMHIAHSQLPSPDPFRCPLLVLQCFGEKFSEIEHLTTKRPSGAVSPAIFREKFAKIIKREDAHPKKTEPPSLPLSPAKKRFQKFGK